MSGLRNQGSKPYDAVVTDKGSNVNGGDPAWAMQHNAKGNWSHYNNSETINWPANGITQEPVPYPGYPSSYWYPQAPPAGPYSGTYSPGSEANGQPPYNQQGMAGYPNGAYNPTHYPGSLHSTNPFYCQAQQPTQPPYPSQAHCETGPHPVAPGVGGQPECNQSYPVPEGQASLGYPYQQYGKRVTDVSQNPPYLSQPLSCSGPQLEAWPQAPGYGLPQQQWRARQQRPAASYENSFMSSQHQAWSSAGPSALTCDPKVPQYSGYPHPGQSSPQIGPQTRPPNPGSGQRGEYSSPPQLYTQEGRKPEPYPAQKSTEEEPPPPQGPQLSDNPDLARIQQVTEHVRLLEEDVNEFVGRKADRSYRCLEELLTKELLELDSIETRGQESMRQARKEAVQKVQGVLDRLERKAF
ncbi:BAG family molecular chaperone regulator 4-like [Acipenser oxyrinchus oxyrinchus]|uniref:BAG family molecular chaperone regulator 4-like n=1 Tax=Acipenser oxyrinchus oxyrinchus TaxID=40147 RepID=A0AAD8CRA6_ACIOX|nr:BAG family molecular chaperone regulator 4-like [Acipenser oxyrinchus oxyrinchus]KAK1154384.1 BAG family molecular chaperone regulator 4-like [Acipenser oxyrinchus oxyrinchus]